MKNFKILSVMLTLIFINQFAMAMGRPPKDFCESKGNNTNYEYIESVKINSSLLETYNNGGYDFFPEAEEGLLIVPGEKVEIELNPGFRNDSYVENWSIWIDLNGDQDFDDQGELVFSEKSSSKVTGSFSIPAGITAKSTRMRVSMKYGRSASSACEIFTYGEVEDYAIKIVSKKIIHLDSGYNFFAFPVELINKNAVDAFLPLINNETLIYVENDSNNRLYQSEDGDILINGVTWVNEIGDISSSEGYKIKVNQDIDLPVKGFPIQLPLNVEFNQGFNLMPYHIKEEMDALEFFDPLIRFGFLEKVIAEDGKSLINFMGSWINQIGNLRTNKAYYIKVNRDLFISLDSSSDPLLVHIGYEKINLSVGHNLISFSIDHDFICSDSEFEKLFSRDPRDVFASLINDGSLVYVEDENTNRFYQSKDGDILINGVAWVNEIGDISNSEGYKVKVNQDTSLYSFGFPIQLPLNVELHKGFNLMPYPIKQEQNAFSFFKPLIDKGILEKVIDKKGQRLIFDPFEGSWINQIDNLKTNEAYYIKVNRDLFVGINKNGSLFINSTN